MDWEEFQAERERFDRWEAHWTLIYDRLYQGGLVLGAVTVFAPVFGEWRAGNAALVTQIVAFLVWRLVARHRFKGMDRWLERLRAIAEGRE